MTRKYKNENLLQILVILGAFIGLVSLILYLARMENYGFVDPLVALNRVLIFIVGLVIVVITFITGFRPNDPIPFHWLTFLILAILLVVFGAGIWACVLLVIAFLVALIEEL
ncbi:MAG: hypothetical protein ACFFCE_02620 [Promethearchaeota archaeon]